VLARISALALADTVTPGSGPVQGLSKLARKPDPAPKEPGQERTVALAGEMALQAGGSAVTEMPETRFTRVDGLDMPIR
jgi:hypothetical protein